MAKRKKSRSTDIAMPMMPSPAKRRRWAAESMARTMMDTEPATKRRENAITSAVLSAATKASTSSRQD